MPDPLAIAAGEFKHFITIAQANTTEDKFGGSSPDMAGATPIGNSYAKIEQLTLREMYTAQQRVSEVTHRVSLRWMPGVKAGMLVWHGRRQFQIQGVDNVKEMNKLLVLLCLERDDSVREEGAGQ
jgi:SPP1 family predicted phage head-tail adaptor